MFRRSNSSFSGGKRRCSAFERLGSRWVCEGATSLRSADQGLRSSFFWTGLPRVLPPPDGMSPPRAAGPGDLWCRPNHIGAAADSGDRTFSTRPPGPHSASHNHPPLRDRTGRAAGDRALGASGTGADYAQRTEGASSGSSWLPPGNISVIPGHRSASFPVQLPSNLPHVETRRGEVPRRPSPPPACGPRHDVPPLDVRGRSPRNRRNALHQPGVDGPLRER